MVFDDYLLLNIINDSESWWILPLRCNIIELLKVMAIDDPAVDWIKLGHPKKMNTYEQLVYILC